MKINQVVAGKHACYLSLMIHDWESSVAVFRHNFLDIFNKIFIFERFQMILHHKMTDSHTLINQTGGNKCRKASE